MTEVLSAPGLYDEQSHHISDSILRQSPPNHSPIYIGTPRSYSPRRSNSSSSLGGTSDRGESHASSSPPSPQAGPYVPRSFSFHATPPSSISLDFKDDSFDDNNDWLPTFGESSSHKPAAEQLPCRAPSGPELPISPLPTPDSVSTPAEDAEAEPLPPVADDSAVDVEPSRQVDYLSHDWREEDIWSSWRHVVSRRKEYGEISRLENASWRQWAKQKHRLTTVSPETLNW